MAHLKHPILGDPLYGGALKLPRAASEELVAALRGFRRQALHAEVLEFVHPLSGQPLRCSEPVPEDMLELMRLLREDRAARAETGRRRTDRKSVVQGTSVSVRVDLGGGGINKK